MPGNGSSCGVYSGTQVPFRDIVDAIVAERGFERDSRCCEDWRGAERELRAADVAVAPRRRMVRARDGRCRTFEAAALTDVFELVSHFGSAALDGIANARIVSRWCL